MHIELKPAPFEPYSELDTYESRSARSGKYGATGIFIGTMRDFSENENVESMYLEHYPEMTEKHLHEICDEAARKWSLLDTLVLHRVGKIQIGEAIVLVAVWSAHRGDALDACRYIIEDLKHRAPFWKKEKLQDGERWVDQNTSGYKNHTKTEQD